MRALLVVLAAVLLLAGCGGSNTVHRTPPRIIVLHQPPPRLIHYGAVSAPAVGEQLMTTNGTWTPHTPTGYTYQWQDCSRGVCENISGATSAIYTIQVSDEGHSLVCVVTATWSGGRGSERGGPTGMVPGSCSGSAPCIIAAPTISGGTDPGDTLIVSSLGNWTNSPQIYSIEWEECNGSGGSCTAANDGVETRDCGQTGYRPITTTTCPDADSTNWNAYVVQPSDAGHTIEVSVVASNGTLYSGDTAVQSNPASSAPTTMVTAGAPDDTAAPALSTNSPVIGTALSVTQGTWSGSGVSYAYRWEDCMISDDLPLVVTYEGGQAACRAISGANHSTYTPTSSDGGFDLTAEVTARNGDGSQTVAANATTNYVPVPPALIGTPSIAGQAVLGATLTAFYHFSGSVPSYTYQWKDCNSSGASCANISGATSQTYVVASSDEGHTIECTVTAGNASGAQTASGTSGHTPVIQVPTGSGTPSNTGLPIVSGTVGYGGTLTTSVGAWSGVPTSYTYRWEDCNSSGASCTNVTAGGNAYAYTLGYRDLGHTLRVRVTATNFSRSTSATSAATSTVPTPSSSQTGGTPLGLTVAGNQLLNDAGQTVEIHGADRSGNDYACVQGLGFADGPTDAGSAAAMTAWNMNDMRLGANEACWLGSQGTPSGSTYQSDMSRYVKLLHTYGMYTEISLTAAGAGKQNTNRAACGCEPFAPDEDHSPWYWHGLASAFKSDPNVILAPWSETNANIYWNCYMTSGCTGAAQTNFASSWPLDGDVGCGFGSQAEAYDGDCYFYTTASMQQAINVMRAAGYNGPISIPCIGYADDCANPYDTRSQTGSSYENQSLDGGTWTSTHPTDQDNSLVAEVHFYSANQSCDTVYCYADTVAPILAAGFPVVAGETGQMGDDAASPACSTYRGAAGILPWFAATGVGWNSYAWDAYGGDNTGVLIGSYEPVARPNEPSGESKPASGWYSTCVQSYDRAQPGSEQLESSGRLRRDLDHRTG